MSDKCCCDKPGHCPWHDCIVDSTQLSACRSGNPPNSVGEPCIYLGEYQEDIWYTCRHFGRCSLDENNRGEAWCRCCPEKLRRDDKQFAQKWRDPLRIFDREGKINHGLRNMLRGGAAFLVCGGPSINQVNFHRLRERGIFSLAINNVAGYVPVSAFTCSDPPMKFHQGIFLDPKIIKFIPSPKLKPKRGKLRIKQDGKFHWMDISTCDCPNVWGYERRSWLMPDDTWFTEPSAAWGNHQVGVLKTGLEKTVNTMLLGMRILQYLGCRRMFLLGVDFKMREGVGLRDNYSFGEQRDAGAIQSNNNQYTVVNKWLCQMRPVWESFGFETYNCYRESSLRAFDYVPFDVALEECRGMIPVEPFDLQDWYLKK